LKKAAQVFYLHFALKKRVFFEEILEKQEQVCLCVWWMALVVFVTFVNKFFEVVMLVI
jgi:phospholipase D1/2